MTEQEGDRILQPECIDVGNQHIVTVFQIAGYEFHPPVPASTHCTKPRLSVELAQFDCAFVVNTNIIERGHIQALYHNKRMQISGEEGPPVIKQLEILQCSGIHLYVERRDVTLSRSSLMDCCSACRKADDNDQSFSVSFQG